MLQSVNVASALEFVQTVATSLFSAVTGEVFHQPLASQMESVVETDFFAKAVDADIGVAGAREHMLQARIANRRGAGPELEVLAAVVEHTASEEVAAEHTELQDTTAGTAPLVLSTELMECDVATVETGIAAADAADSTAVAEHTAAAVVAEAHTELGHALELVGNMVAGLAVVDIVVDHGPVPLRIVAAGSECVG